MKTPDELAQARRVASRKRAALLLRVHQLELTPTEAIEVACLEGNEALLRIRLRQLLMSIPKKGEKVASRMLTKMHKTLGSNEEVHDHAISWLVDSRAGGRRWAAWLDACAGPTDLRESNGFPWLKSREKATR